MATKTTGSFSAKAAALLGLTVLAAMAGGAAAAALPLTGTACPADYFMCMSGEGCVPKETRCDGVNDCEDATDEYGCVKDADGKLHPPPEPEAAPPAKAASSEAESLESLEAEGEEVAVEVAVGEAEAQASNYTSNYTSNDCLEGEHRCLDGTCIAKERLCDATRDCYDGSDEDVLAGCLAKASTQATGDAEWVEALSPFALSGVDHLPLGMARLSPPSTAIPRECTEDEFRCHDGTCVPSNAICNNHIDCPDGSDERLACPVGDFDCRDDFKCKDRRCVPIDWVCNNLNDCVDGSDEDPELCANWTIPTPISKASQFMMNQNLTLRSSSGDPCDHMESVQKRLCWEHQLQELKMEELKLRQRVALEQLENVQLETAAAKELRLEQIQTAELERRAAADLLQQQKELHRLRLQILIKEVEPSLTTTEPTMKLSNDSEPPSSNITTTSQ